jgi:peroxiredoxin
MRALETGRPVPESLANARVKRRDGEELRLGDTWKEQDALLVFVRHFACAGCSAHVEELVPRLDEIDALGVRTVLIGCGSVDQMMGFMERHRLFDERVVLVTDPSRKAYVAAGMVRSLWGTLGPVAIVKMIGAMTRGHANGRTEGDLYQMGGTLLVRKGGTLAFYHHAETLGEHAPLVDVVDAVLRIRAEGSKGALLV